MIAGHEALVVDASVAIKWYVPEPGSAEAQAILESDRLLLAPDLLVAEIGNILWKRVQRGLNARTDVEEIARTFLAESRVHLVPSAGLMFRALEIANTYGATVYDALYVALAEGDGIVVVTADERLANRLAATPLAPHVRSLSTF
jgi:predicted nucleic acid-binding protein